MCHKATSTRPRASTLLRLVATCWLRMGQSCPLLPACGFGAGSRRFWKASTGSPCKKNQRRIRRRRVRSVVVRRSITSAICFGVWWVASKDMRILQRRSSCCANMDRMCQWLGPWSPARTRRRGHREMPRLEWNDHRWRQRNHRSETKEGPTNRSSQTGKLATVESAKPNPQRWNLHVSARGGSQTSYLYDPGTGSGSSVQNTPL